MKIFVLFLLLVGVVLADIPDYQQIVAGQRVGPVTKSSTRADIAAIVGTAYMEEGSVYVGEGESVPATIVYPGHDNRRISVIWKKGPAATATPESAWISGSESEWKTANNISLGTGLARLEKINGQAFKFLGFDWDYGGAVTSWGGRLEQELEGIHIRLRIPEGGYEMVGGEQMMPLSGDHELSSGHPVFFMLDPVVDRIVVNF